MKSVTVRVMISVASCQPCLLSVSLVGLSFVFLRVAIAATAPAIVPERISQKDHNGLDQYVMLFIHYHLSQLLENRSSDE